VTTARRRELMDERVADVEGRALAARAWARADGVRRRRRYAVTGTAAAAVLVVAGGVAVLDDRTDADAPPSGRPTTSSSPEPSTSPPEIPRATLSGEFRGAPFWWAPAASRDAELPVLQVPGLPEELSMAQAPYGDEPPPRVDAVFGLGKQQYVLLDDSEMVTVDLSDRLGPVADEGGNPFSPIGPTSVSPDGSQVFFRQPGRVEVWDLPSNSWRTVETPEYENALWSLDGQLWTGDGPAPERAEPWTGPDIQYSPVVVGPGGSAELDFTGGAAEVPGADEPGHYANPELLAAVQDGSPGVLGIGIDDRSKGCCSLVGWFSHDFVLFQAVSRGEWRVLAWRVGTPDLYRVSVLTDFPWSGPVFSWAENAFG
jgi:hypothetical protein